MKLHKNAPQFKLTPLFPVFSVCLCRLMNRHIFRDSGDCNYNGKCINTARWTNRLKDLGESRVEL
jgi:hypothetical protein